jgi:hypothetical protein
LKQGKKVKEKRNDMLLIATDFLSSSEQNPLLDGSSY